MDFFSITSGSSGNCICVGDSDYHVMIDAGISGKRIEDGMNRNGFKTSDMNGILITHEHIDHISGLGVLARRYGIPIYATRKTIDAIAGVKSLGSIDPGLFHPITAGQKFQILEEPPTSRTLDRSEALISIRSTFLMMQLILWHMSSRAERREWVC